MYRIVLTGVAILQATAVSAQEPATAAASFVDAQGKTIGAAELSAPASGGVFIKIEVENLPTSSWVAFHVHETGTCDHATGHESAGKHFNPGSKEHGFKAVKGPHPGDMPNLYVGADGMLRAEVFNSAVTLDDAPTAIRGRALMIHSKADDYQTQPSGAAGDRVACAAIK